VTVQLADLTDALKRALAVPGTFDTAYPNTTEADLLGSLMDGFSEAQLDRFFSGWDFDGITGVLTSTLDRAAAALVVIYASTRILQSEIRDLKSHVKYVAGAVTFEEDSPASVMVKLLQTMEDRKKELRTQSRNAGAAAAFYMADRYALQNGDWFTALYANNYALGLGWSGRP
jgi:hypothetical protein